MPKQPKKGLSYFSLDCDIFSAKSGLKPLIDRYEADGLAVYIHILCDVYASGYYFKPDNYEDYLYALAKDVGISVEKVKLILTFMADRTLLDAFSLNKNTVFTSHGIHIRYCEAMKGRKKRIAEIRGDYWLLSEKDEREIETFYKSTQSGNKSEKMSDKSEKMSDKSEKITINKHNINKYIFPLTPNGGQENGKDRFFSAYPKLKSMERLDDSGIDYAALYEHFQRSEFLQSRFSAKWVVENYADIIAGVHDDKASAEEQAKARAEWYRQRRERAEEISEYNRRKAEAIDGYTEDLKEMKRLEIATAKAEVSGAEDYSGIILSEILRLRERLKQRLAGIGLSEDDLQPKHHCKKCNDTGYLPNGTPCDCFEKEKRCQQKMI